MKYFLVFKKVLVLFFIILLASCASRKDIVYYQNIDGLAPNSNTASYEIKIQPDDLLLIIVSAEDPEIAAPFNLKTVMTMTDTKLATGQQINQQYLVDSQGNIEFPVLGKLKVGGLSRSEVMELLQNKISAYIKNPIVNMRITNFKVAVQGEVNAPGTYTINSERVTLIEALSMARDLTIYGQRNNVLVIRELDGQKTYNRVDLTKADFINSPFYYLAQNDVVYVEPNNSKVNGAAVGPNTGVWVSITSLLITVIALITR